MKRLLPVLLGIVACTQIVGCKLRKDAMAEAAAQAAADKQASDSARALDKAKQELRAKAAVYEALAGDYEGTYTANEKMAVNVKLHISTSNVPAPAELDRMDRESVILQRAETIALDVQTEESLPTNSRHSVFCQGMNLKPDFAQGMLRFDCAGQGAVSARRLYVFSFDTGDVIAMDNETPETAKAISAEIGNDIITGKQNQLGGFRLSIMLNPEFGTRFVGALSRTK